MDGLPNSISFFEYMLHLLQELEKNDECVDLLRKVLLERKGPIIRCGKTSIAPYIQRNAVFLDTYLLDYIFCQKM